jgi:hypothetical protein
MTVAMTRVERDWLVSSRRERGKQAAGKCHQASGDSAQHHSQSPLKDRVKLRDAPDLACRKYGETVAGPGRMCGTASHRMVRGVRRIGTSQLCATSGNTLGTRRNFA